MSSSESELLSKLNNRRSETSSLPSNKRKDPKTGQNMKGSEVRNYHMHCSRPNFVDRWLDYFKPWLSRDKVDPQRPFCEACRCRVSCNKLFHLKRHAQTSKHQSNLIVYLNAKGLQHNMYEFGQRKERKKNTPKVKTKTKSNASKREPVFMGISILDNEQEKLKDLNTQKTMPDFEQIYENGNDSGSTTLHLYDEESVSSHKGNAQLLACGKDENEINKRLLMEIHKVKNEIIASFTELFSKAYFDKKEANHVDLFFDSVSSSIKRFPPSLVAESKMRVSQLVCEMELRAITESESGKTEKSFVLISTPLDNAYVINNEKPTPDESDQVGSSHQHASFRAND